MFRPGLCSVTFRRMSPSEVIGLAARAGLGDIQWGSDIHVPAGNAAAAREVRKQMDDAGVTCETYGSYYRAGLPDGECIDGLLENACLLGAGAIRIWAGGVGSAGITREARLDVMRDLERVLKLAAASRITLVLEFHGGTLADTAESAAGLLQEMAHPFLKTAWQPAQHWSHGERLRSLEMLLPWLHQLHVFHWVNHPESCERMPLANGREAWRDYLKMAESCSGWAYLEFVRNDDPQQLAEDAEILRQWLGA
jgi:sugar phosphate isomerase/epimerase